MPIIPVYNRPDEVDELLSSLTTQKTGDFEVIVVEDGSSNPCKEVCDKYTGQLDLHYFSKKNSGPGQSRNYGAERAKGEYLIVLDSDVVLPEGYLTAVEAELHANPCDAFGGPDSAHPSFTPTQKAISYSMTSFFTTVSARTSISASASSRAVTPAGSSPRHGCGTSGAPTSANSSNRFTTAASHA